MNLITQSCFGKDGLWLTVHQKKKYENKMDQYTSIALNHNTVCDQRRASNTAIKNCICKWCYSYIQATIHPAIRKKMEINSSVFSDVNYKPSKINTINNCLRYISFGEVNHQIQVINILKHAQMNNHLNKAVWSKMYGLWQSKGSKTGIKGLHGGIKNFNLIWSCSKLDCNKFIIPRGFTKSFYVYTNEQQLNDAKLQATDQGYTVIECNKMCAMCNHCYKNSENTIVMEVLRMGRGKVKLS